VSKRLRPHSRAERREARHAPPRRLWSVTADRQLERLGIGLIGETYERPPSRLQNQLVLALGTDARRIVIVILDRKAAGENRGAHIRLPERLPGVRGDPRVLALLGPAVPCQAVPRAVTLAVMLL